MLVSVCKSAEIMTITDCNPGTMNRIPALYPRIVSELIGPPVGPPEEN